MHQGQHQQHSQGFEHSHTHTQYDSLAKLNAALSLAKAMPPSKLKKNLIGLVSLAPQIQDNLLQKIELPMEIDNTLADRPFLKTEFNRQGDSYRNPYTNYYCPQNTQGYRPSGIYRVLQQNGSVLFGEYVKQYYGNDTIGNFYVMQNHTGNGNFSCGFFAKKISKQEDGFNGSWDSFNIVDVTHNGNVYHYNLSSTILIQMDINNSGINITGFLKKIKQQTRTYNNISQQQLYEHHLVNIGEMIQDMETIMRQHLQAVYVARTKQIIFTTRYQNTIGMEQHRMNLANDLKKLRFGAN